MKHFICVLDPEAKAPAGTQNVEDWFEGYKWMVEGECYIPVDEESPVPSLVEPGDRIWFFYWREERQYAEVRGSIEVLRVEPDPLHSRTELWYDGASCQEAQGLEIKQGAQFSPAESFPLILMWCEEQMKSDTGVTTST